MKTKAITGVIVILFLASMLSVAPVAAQEPEVIVTGGGWFIANHGEVGDKCSFGIVAMDKDGTWSGQGSWMDKDWVGGKLKAILKVDAGAYTPDYEWGGVGPAPLVIIYGDAKVFIDHKYVGTYDFLMWLWDTDIGDNGGLTIGGIGYMGVDVNPPDSLSGGQIVIHVH